MDIRALIILLPLITISCQTASVIENKSSMGVSSKVIATTPKTSDSKVIEATSKNGARKSLLTKVKEKLMQQSLAQQKLVQQQLEQQKLTQQKEKLVPLVDQKSNRELPQFWTHMNDEHRSIWNEGNPYLRKSLTKYYSDPNVIHSIEAQMN